VRDGSPAMSGSRNSPGGRGDGKKNSRKNSQFFPVFHGEMLYGRLFKIHHIPK
jgi:hypothetical protein